MNDSDKLQVRLNNLRDLAEHAIDEHVRRFAERKLLELESEVIGEAYREIGSEAHRTIRTLGQHQAVERERQSSGGRRTP